MEADYANWSAGLFPARLNQAPEIAGESDLVMPETEGLEVIMELRRKDPDVRIIAMSGGGLGRAEEYLKIAEKAGAQLTLSKPFGNAEFLDVSPLGA